MRLIGGAIDPFPSAFLRKQSAQQLVGHRVAGAVAYVAAKDRRARQSQIANGIEHLVTHSLIGMAQATRRKHARAQHRPCLSQTHRDDHRRIGKHLGHRALLDDLTGVHHGHAVADTADHVHLVGNQHDGQLQFTVDLGQQLQDRGRGLRVEGTGGLVA